MSALNDRWSAREVDHEWGTHVLQWEQEQYADDDAMQYRHATQRGLRVLARMLSVYDYEEEEDWR